MWVSRVITKSTKTFLMNQVLLKSQYLKTNNEIQKAFVLTSCQVECSFLQTQWVKQRGSLISWNCHETELVKFRKSISVVLLKVSTWFTSKYQSAPFTILTEKFTITSPWNFDFHSLESCYILKCLWLVLMFMLG